MRNRRAHRALLLLAPLLLAAKLSVPLELPPPVQFPQFVDSLKVSKALVTALTNKKWLVEADTGEAVRGALKIRRHALRIRIEYTTRGIVYHYVDSVALGYEEDEGERYIHPNANKWLEQLEDEVNIQLQPLLFEREPAEVVPVEPPPPPPPKPR